PSVAPRSSSPVRPLTLRRCARWIAPEGSTDGPSRPPASRPSRGAEAEAASASAERALHLELHEPVELDGAFHRQLLREHLEEALDDEVLRLVLGEAA